MHDQDVDEAEQDARRAERNPVVQAVARAGFVAAGLVQVLVGVLAIEVGLHRDASESDQTGALRDVAHTPGGPVVLWAAAAAALALGLWLLLSGVLARDDDRRRRWGRRLRHWGRGVVYLAIGVEAVRVALDAGASSARSSRRGSADLLQVPGGPVVLAVIGGVVLVVGGCLVWIGVAHRFTRIARVPDGPMGVAFVVLGTIGYTARGLAIGVVGVLVVVAAVTLEPKKASGLDSALHTLTTVPFGEPLLVAVGLGWILAGVFSLLLVKWVDLEA